VTAHYNTTSHTLEPLVSEFGATRVRVAQASLGLETDVDRLFDDANSSDFGAVAVAVINHGHYISPDVRVVVFVI
jgi:hypothetical protein